MLSNNDMLKLWYIIIIKIYINVRCGINISLNLFICIGIRSLIVVFI